jgi:serine/threonine protein kinase
MSEIKIHESLGHPNVVKFLHNFEDNQNVYIVLELCTNKVPALLSRPSTTSSSASADSVRARSSTSCCRSSTD